MVEVVVDEVGEMEDEMVGGDLEVLRSAEVNFGLKLKVCSHKLQIGL